MVGRSELFTFYRSPSRSVPSRLSGQFWFVLATGRLLLLPLLLLLLLLPLPPPAIPLLTAAINTATSTIDRSLRPVRNSCLAMTPAMTTQRGESARGPCCYDAHKRRFRFARGFHFHDKTFATRGSNIAPKGEPSRSPAPEAGAAGLLREVPAGD